MVRPISKTYCAIKKSDKEIIARMNLNSIFAVGK
jgi:hypothetical protein